jgi:hypothetical protein
MQEANEDSVIWAFLPIADMFLVRDESGDHATES